MSSAATTSTSKPIGSARPFTTSIVCGWQSAATRKRSAPFFLLTRWSIAIASAAAVASSSSEAFATGRPVRSETAVW